jgi:hypothetical protein
VHRAAESHIGLLHRRQNDRFTARGSHFAYLSAARWNSHVLHTKMPRRHFQADLQKAAEGTSIAGISDVLPSGDDGEFTFMCVADGQQLQISVMIPGKFDTDQPWRTNS